MTTAIMAGFPVEDIVSVNDLMALAHAIECRAAERYEQLALALTESDPGGLAGVFRSLALLERQHESDIVDWAAREGRAVSGAVGHAGILPECFGEDDVAEALSPYRALAIAVRNEELAFGFYCYIAAHAEDGETRVRAEGLAREELRHVAELRRRRRTLYHDGHRDPDWLPTPRSAAALRQLGDALEDLPAELPTTQSAEATADLKHRTLQAIDLYLEAAATATDEAMLETAHALAAHATTRLAMLHKRETVQRG